MKAIDTSVIARYIVKDDPAQAASAESILRDGAYIPLTVLIEAAWLLRTRYGMERRDVARILQALLTLPTVDVPDVEWVNWALERSLEGADLPDMLHLVGARFNQAFATFDKRIAAGAGADGPVPVETLR